MEPSIALRVSQTALSFILTIIAPHLHNIDQYSAMAANGNTIGNGADVEMKDETVTEVLRPHSFNATTDTE